MSEPLKEPSDEFMRAFTHSGSPVQDCDFCGRTNYDQNGEFMDDGELERLNKQREEKPDKYFGQNCGISWGSIDGKTFVWGCPCNKTRPYEDFIWRYRRRIADYLKARSAEELKAAQSQMESVAGL